VILSNQMLILFAIFIDRTNSESNENNTIAKAENTFAAFSFIIFIIYFIFGSMLAVFRNDVIKQGEIFHQIICQMQYVKSLYHYHVVELTSDEDESRSKNAAAENI